MIKIANLYDDLLNLYGDSGNCKALAFHLRETGEEVQLDRLRYGDKLSFADYDICIIGSGTEQNLYLALHDLMPCKEELSQYKNNGGFLLATGNSIELFGRSVNCKPALGLFDYTATYQEERIVRDVCLKSSLVDDDIIGFENHKGTLDREESLILEDNFLLTYTIGPLLVRNPKLTDCLIRKLLANSDRDPSKADYTLEQQAYELSRSTDLKNIRQS